MRLSNKEKEILKVILMRGGASLEELSEELRINYNEVKEVVDLLIIKGLIREVVLGRDCNSQCKFCPLSALCPKLRGLGAKLYLPTNKALKIYRALLK